MTHGFLVRTAAPGFAAAARHCRRALIAGGLGLLAATAQAQEAGDPFSPSFFRIGGFGSVGYVRDNRSDMAPLRDVTQRPDRGFSSGPSWKLDSRVGLQAELRASPTLDFVVQAVARDQVATGSDSVVELAYAGWAPADNLDVRVGRVGYDAFLMSDTRNVGYAYPWVRPFTEFYGWVPIFSVDGADAVWTIADGGGQWRIKGQLGATTMTVPMGQSNVKLDSRDLVGLTVSRQSGPWRYKAGLSRFTIRDDAQPPALLQLLQANLDNVAAALPAIRDEARDLRANLQTDDTRVRYMTIGGAYDDGRWLAQAELSRSTTSRQLIPHGTMAYVAVAYRSGNWMPYVALSSARPGEGIRRAESNWNVFGPGVGGLQDSAITVLNQVRMHQRTTTVGARWDFHSQAALKLQVESTRVSPAGYGIWFWNPALINESRRVNQTSLSLDFVF